MRNPVLREMRLRGVMHSLAHPALSSRCHIALRRAGRARPDSSLGVSVAHPEVYMHTPPSLPTRRPPGARGGGGGGGRGGGG